MNCTNPSVMFWYRPEYRESRPYGLERPIWSGEFRALSDYKRNQVLTFDDDVMQYYLLPCGKCDLCRVRQRQEWTFRALSELDSFGASAFLTLTVDDSQMQHVFPGGMLCHRPFQLFMKRLRQEIKQPVKFLMCGEYGTHTFRPHYHAVIFGWFPPDYVLFKRKPTYDIFVSDIISRLWRKDMKSPSYGFHTVGLANEKTIRYLVGYVMKKNYLPDVYNSAPPYLRASTRPALGLGFFERYKNQIFAHGADLIFENAFVYLGHSKIGLPRYFTRKYAEVSDNVDYVSLLNFRRNRLAELPPVSKSDLERVEDWFKQITKGSHNLTLDEV